MRQLSILRALITALLLLTTATTTGCFEERLAYSQKKQAFAQQKWVQSMTDEIEAALKLAKSRGENPDGDLAVCVDTSGSISSLDFLFFIEHINEQFGKDSDRGKKSIYLIIGDTEVDWEGLYKGKETLAEGSPARQAAVWKGGGGTDFRGLIAAGIQSDPAAILYLTDGFGILPEEVPEIPIVWVLNRKCWTGPNGQVYDPNCEELARFGEITSLLDETLEDQS